MACQAVPYCRYKDKGWAYHEGDPSDGRMLAAAAKRGVRLTSRSRPLRPEDMTTFDYILGENIWLLHLQAGRELPIKLGNCLVMSSAGAGLAQRLCHCLGTISVLRAGWPFVMQAWILRTMPQSR